MNLLRSCQRLFSGGHEGHGRRGGWPTSNLDFSRFTRANTKRKLPQKAKERARARERARASNLAQCLTLQLSSLASLELIEVLGRTIVSVIGTQMDHRPTTCMTYEKIRSLLKIPQLFSKPNFWRLQLWSCDVCWQCYVSILKYLEVIFPRCAILPSQL